MKVISVPIVTCALGTVTKGGGRKSGEHPNYIIIDNGQNTEKSPGDLGILTVTQTPVKNHQLKLM